jgi:hypothetical protein
MEEVTVGRRWKGGEGRWERELEPKIDGLHQV